MQRLLTWIAGAVGGVAVYRWLARARTHESAPPVGEPDARAAELRAKLEESRALVDEREAFEAGETPVDEAEPASDPDERRRRVHEHGRAAVERMRSSTEP